MTRAGAQLHMLDTNVVSHFLRGHGPVEARLLAMPMQRLCISVITEGELRYGLARRPDARKLHAAVNELLRGLTVLPWTSAAARAYGELRATLERQGQPLSPLDTQIAAHALAASATLVTQDRAFQQVPNLALEDWATPIAP